MHKESGKALKVEEAIGVILADAPTSVATTVPLAESIAHILAEDIQSDISMPPFDKSAMDGYALRCADTANVPTTLRVIDDVPAGKFPTKAVKSGEASRIMTGAPIPEGADAIVMVEMTDSPDREHVTIKRAAKKGDHICRMGEDLKEGDIVLRKGAEIRAQEVAVLAAVGRAHVPVFKKPRIALMSTGDELVEVGEKPGMGKIRNSNSYSIAAQIAAAGLDCRMLGIARDTREDIRRMVHEGIEESDVLVVSGGVSVGEYDFVIDALKAEGVETLLHQVMIKPGRPFTYGRRGDKRVFALPGNPVSTYVIFDVFVKPFLKKMCGYGAAEGETVHARVLSGTTKLSDRLQYVPGKFRRVNDEILVDIISWHGSADIFALTRANCFVIVPADGGALGKESVADIAPM